MNKDDDIWDAYREGVKPIKLTKKKVTLAKTKPVPTVVRQAAEKHVGPVVFKEANQKPLSDWNAPMEKRIERDMRAGTIDIDARIDLHGMTQDEAYKTITRFIAAQAKQGNRNLLVITGRGSVLKGGILRSNLRAWLESLPQADKILRMCQAAVSHGGAGAFYVMLKRK